MCASTRPGVTRHPPASSVSRAGPREDPRAAMRPPAIARSSGSARSGRRQLRRTRSSTPGQYADFFSGGRQPGWGGRAGGDSTPCSSPAKVSRARVTGRRARPSMPSFTRRLRQETPGWVRDGVVTAQQAGAILGRYRGGGRWFQRPIAIFSIVGGALVALAIALVIAHNWAEIPRWAKLAGVLTLLLGSSARGLFPRARDRRLVGEGLVVRACGLLFLGIDAIGALYTLS